MVMVVWNAAKHVLQSLIRNLSSELSLATFAALILMQLPSVAQAGCISGRCQSPLLTFTQPAMNASYRANENITVTGRAYGNVVYDSEGDGHPFRIQRVEIYKNGTVVGNATLIASGFDTNDIPYSDFSYTLVGGFSAAGANQIGAKPYDTGSNSGAAAGSVDTRVVNIAANATPVVSILTPAVRPEDPTVLTVGNAVTLTAAASDSDGTVVSVQYFDGGSAISGPLPSAPYSFTWTVAPLGSRGISAVATDNSGAQTSTFIPLTINDRPSVALNVSDISSQNPGAITLTATASDSVGGLGSIKFFKNGSEIASMVIAPFTTRVTGLGSGTYTFVARAIDGYGVFTDSAPYNLSVNYPPVVALAAPAAGALGNVALPANVGLVANASDQDGTISKVEFLVNGTVVASATSAPYTANWSATAGGSYMLQARATDNTGKTTTSGITLVSVNVPPAATITSPASGTYFLPGDSIPVTVSASDGDGNISKIELFDGASLIGTWNASSATKVIASATIGTHVLVAKAYDNLGVQVSSAPVTVNVGVGEPPQSSGNGTPGKLDGVLNVSNVGAAEYVIPLTVPPGTAGMIPKIALGYSSKGGNGPLGVGWSINGLSKITRCERDFAHDGMKGAVQLDATDRFCLDGKRLILVAGTYGAPGSEYRTEIDGYTKVVAVGTVGNGPASFQVSLNNGNKLEYGNTSDSRWTLPGTTTPYGWAVNKVADARGNYYNVAYTVSGSGEQLPLQISYTGNAVQSVAPYNSIRFNYEQNRSDIEIAFIAGAKISNAARLGSIQTFNGATAVTEYRFTYDSVGVTGRSRLRSATQCNGAGNVCMKPTVFDWESTPLTFNGPVLEFPNIDAQFGAVLAQNGIVARDGLSNFIDLNGDGRPDRCMVAHKPNPFVPDDEEVDLTDELVCALTQPGGAAPVVRKILQDSHGGASYFQYVDFNADGFIDVCSAACLFGSAEGPNAGTNPGSVLAPGAGSKGMSSDWLDVDGDGWVDYCRRTNDGVDKAPWRIECYMNLRGSFGPVVNLATLPYIACGSANCESLQYEWTDVTGDGVKSFCRLESGAMICRKWTNAGLAAEISTGTINLGERLGGRAWTDVNGDGKDDFCRVLSDAPGTNDVTGRLACTLSTGKGFGDTIMSGTIAIGHGSGYVNGSDNTRQWRDVNGDGKADYCRAITSGTTQTTRCLLSTGSGFGAEVDLVAPGGAQVYQRGIVDVNGDDKLDLCVQQADGSLRCYTSAGAEPDVLVKVTDGLGSSAQVEYGRIFEESLYKKGSGATYPSFEMQDSTQVVRSVTISNGIGGTLTTSYKYEGASYDKHRGVTTFAAMESIAPTGIKTRKEFRRDFPFDGLAARTTVSKDGIILSETVETHEANGAAPYHVNMVKTVTKTNDLNGAFLNWIETTTPAQSFDAWGNALQVETVFKNADGTPNGYSQTLTQAYQNDVDNWLFGLPTATSNTSRMPAMPDSTRTVATAYHQSNPGFGLPKQLIVEPDNGGTGTNTLRLVTDFTYDNFGNLLTKVVSGAAIATRTSLTNTYDAQGRGPMTSKNALGHLDNYTYDWRFGLPETLTGPNSLTTTWRYDDFGRRTSESRADGTQTTLRYNECVECVRGSVYNLVRSDTVIATGANVAPPSREYFDARARPILATELGFSGKVVTRETRYDSPGRIGDASLNYMEGDAQVRWQHYEYDALGRQVLVVPPNQAGTSTDYNGRVVTTTNANGVRFVRTTDSQGKLAKKTDAAGTVDESSITYEYDNWGNLSKTTDAAGNVTIIDYDLLGRKRKLDDPDLGLVRYTVDNLGQVKSQTDAKNQETKFEYDVLGRLIVRTEADLISKWFYETNAAGTPCEKGIGKLCEATASNGYFRRYAYDNLGRPKRQTTHIDADYTAEWNYDAAGRLGEFIYPAISGFPTALSLKYGYGTQGHLKTITNSASGAAYWTRNDVNADGNTRSETYGNGLVGARGYHPQTGRLTTLTAGTALAPSSVQNHVYHYDALGRLDLRQDDTAEVRTVESFGYDNLDRMTSASINAAGSGSQLTIVDYNAIGNIKKKTGVGDYIYPQAGARGPHALKEVSGSVNGVVNPSFIYDDNGNMLSGGARSFTWSSFNMPVTMTKTALSTSPGAGTSTFQYGPEHQRLKQTWVDAEKTLTTVYLADMGLEIESNSKTGITAFKHYVQADGRVVAVQTRNSNATEDVRYLLPDHLGSTSVVTNASGAVVERQAFDPWGDRRGASGAGAGASDPTNAIQPSATTRGFTGHEQLDQGGMGLVHMNGRIYDPTLGRFISADPYIQAPDNTQSYNRYSYVWNSPLNSTDPSGFFGQTYAVEVPGRRPLTDLDSVNLCIRASCSELFQRINLIPDAKVRENVTKQAHNLVKWRDLGAFAGAKGASGSGGYVNAKAAPAIEAGASPFAKGTVAGVGSYFKGVLYDLPAAALAMNGLLGKEKEIASREAAQAVIEGIKLLKENPEEAMEIACFACQHLTSAQESELQARIGARLATGSLISAVSGPVGTTATVGAITGNVISAGIDHRDQAAILRAILTGGAK